MASILAFAMTKQDGLVQVSNSADHRRGAHGQNLALPDRVTAVAAISLRTQLTGYRLIRAHPVQYQGCCKSWTSCSLGLKDPVIQGFGSGGWINETPEAAIRFTDANNGLVVLGLSSRDSMIALRTSDGGKSWKEEAVPAKNGKPFISRDGRFLTVSKWLEGLTLLKAK
jgi:hypothetical protein